MLFKKKMSKHKTTQHNEKNMRKYWWIKKKKSCKTKI